MHSFLIWLGIYVLIYIVPLIVFSLFFLLFSIPVFQKLGILLYVIGMFALTMAIYITFLVFTSAFVYHIYELTRYFHEVSIAAVIGHCIVLLGALTVIITIGLPQILPNQFGYLKLSQFEPVRESTVWIKKHFLLITNQVDINAQNASGHPIIFEKIAMGDVAAIEALLEAGADIDAKGFAEQTPIIKAAQQSRWTIVELLLDRGADIQATSEFGISLPLLASRTTDQAEKFTQSQNGQALSRVREKIAEAGIEHWSTYSATEVKEMLAYDAWPPASQDDLEQYQTEADVVRVQALAHWASLIEEYYEKTGSYPLINDIDLEADAQLYVFIARDEQWQAVADQQSYLPENAYIIYPPEFMYSLEKGLGRQEDIEERYDPQNVSSGAPNFMIYMTQDNNYYLAAHFLNTYSFTAPVRAYQKVEVTNIPEAPYQITYADLQNDADFQRLRSETITSGWFKELIDKNKDRFREEPYHADKAYDIDFTLISGGGFKSLTTLQRTNTQTPSSTISADPKDRLDAYIATNYKNVPLTLTKVQESTSEHIFKANLTDANNTFFLYFVVPTDNTQSILPTSDISQIP